MRIVGVGSPFGADRLGWEVVRQLEASGALADLPSASVALACEDRPGLRLLEWLEAPGLVVLVDAMIEALAEGGRSAAGEVRCFDGLSLPAEAGFTTSHDFGMKAALELAGALGGVLPEIRVFGIVIGDSHPQVPGQGPETDLAAMVAASGIIRKIKELVYNHTKQLDKKGAD